MRRERDAGTPHLQGVVQVLQQFYFCSGQHRQLRCCIKIAVQYWSRFNRQKKQFRAIIMTENSAIRTDTSTLQGVQARKHDGTVTITQLTDIANDLILITLKTRHKLTTLRLLAVPVS